MTKKVARVELLTSSLIHGVYPSKKLLNDSFDSLETSSM